MKTNHDFNHQLVSFTQNEIDNSAGYVDVCTCWRWLRGRPLGALRDAAVRGADCRRTLELGRHAIGVASGGRGGACALRRACPAPPWPYSTQKTVPQLPRPSVQCRRARTLHVLCRTSSVSSALKIWCRSRGPHFT